MKKILIFIFSVYTNSLISQDYYIYVAAESEDEVSLIKFNGGLAKKIYSTDPNDRFKMTYYSGSNRGMDNDFRETYANKVIRLH